MHKLKFLLYGMGVANNAVKRYFDLVNIKYDIYQDSDLVDLDLNNYDVIVKSPGISNDTKIIKEAITKDKLILTDLGLYSMLFKEKFIIGVTGSNGKTTTTTLIGNILKDYYVCGNIGVPLFNSIHNSKLVIECSSFMLEYSSKFKPNIYIVINIEKHHIDHHGSFDKYIESKLKPLKNMSTDDVIIYNYDDVIIKEEIEKYNIKKLSFSKSNEQADIYLNDNFIMYGHEKYLNILDCKLKNEQFIGDFLVTILVGKTLFIEDEIIKSNITNFQSLPHRFEEMIINDQLIVINDSKATNPYATKEAINNLINRYKDYYLILILGGKAINEDYQVLNNINFLDKVYLIGENKNYLKKLFCNGISEFNTIDEVLLDISNYIKDKTVILFSPASPSYDSYSSYIERGNIFKEKIKTIFL